MLEYMIKNVFVFINKEIPFMDFHPNHLILPFIQNESFLTFYKKQ